MEHVNLDAVEREREREQQFNKTIKGRNTFICLEINKRQTIWK